MSASWGGSDRTERAAAAAMLTEQGEPCRYFVTCDRPAIGLVANPIIGPVPCCRRCADQVGAILGPLSDSPWDHVAVAVLCDWPGRCRLHDHREPGVEQCRAGRYPS